jgi:hypothetical protein
MWIAARVNRACTAFSKIFELAILANLRIARMSQQEQLCIPCITPSPGAQLGSQTRHRCSRLPIRGAAQPLRAAAGRPKHLRAAAGAL